MTQPPSRAASNVRCASVAARSVGYGRAPSQFLSLQVWDWLQSSHYGIIQSDVPSASRFARNCYLRWRHCNQLASEIPTASYRTL